MVAVYVAINATYGQRVLVTILTIHSVPPFFKFLRHLLQSYLA